MTPERILELEAKATPAPWAVWDSCSFRRISHKGDGDVICGTYQHSDGHPDLLAKREDLEYLCVLRNNAVALARVAIAARLVRDCHFDKYWHEGLKAHEYEAVTALSEALAALYKEAT